MACAALPVQRGHMRGLPIHRHPGCSVVWYLHIGKCGGTTVSEFLRTIAHLLNYTFFGFWNRDRAWSWQWETSGELACIREAVASGSPHLIVEQHHGTPGMSDDFVGRILQPLACATRRSNCSFTLATTIRDPIDHIRSLSIYNHQWVAHHTGRQSAYHFSMPYNASDLQASYADELPHCMLMSSLNAC